MKPKAIFFDVDGVLIHGYHYNEKYRKPWDEHIEADLGLNRQHFTQEYIFGPFVSEVLVGQKTMHETLTDYIARDDVKCDGDAHSIIKYWLEKDSKINHDLFSHIEKLAKCDDIQLFIATNQAHERAEHLWNNLKFSDHFEKIYHSAGLGMAKNDINYFHQINEAHGFKEGDVLFFDDTPNCIEVAKQAGWHGVQYNNLDDFTSCEVIRNLIELK